MLDDLKFIHQKDTTDSLGVAAKQWHQLQYNYQSVHVPKKDYAHVVIAGMGGSALAADIVKVWPGLSVPYQVVREYTIPAFVDEKSLFIASSYSGNTEETLAALAAAETTGAQIIIITAGGRLAKIAEEKNYPVFIIPAGLQPRMAIFYNLTALVTIFTQAGLVPAAKAAELTASAAWLSEQQASWQPEVPTANNYAKQIAQELVGKSIVVYGGPLTFPAAYKWKINYNENSKTVAWCGRLPEFNHNEFLGWSSHPIKKPYAVIDLRSHLENSRVQKRFELSAQLLSGMRPAPIVIQAQGESVLQTLLWLITLGDFTSLYLALLNGVDPAPVELITKLKAALAA